MKKLNSKLLLLTLLVLYMPSFSKEIVLDKLFFTLTMVPNKMNLIDFPFTIQDKQVLGLKTNIKVEKVDNSIYLKIKEGEADVAIWGDGKAILLTIVADPKSNERRVSFTNEKDYLKEKESKTNQWNHDTELVAILEDFIDRKKPKDFSLKKIDENFIIDKKLQVKKIIRAVGKKYNVEVWKIKNTSNKFVDLFEVKRLYKASEDNDFNIECNTFDDRYLVPGQETKAFVAFKEK